MWCLHLGITCGANCAFTSAGFHSQSRSEDAGKAGGRTTARLQKNRQGRRGEGNCIEEGTNGNGEGKRTVRICLQCSTQEVSMTAPPAEQGHDLTTRVKDGA
jgi:hypothetical protein